MNPIFSQASQSSGEPIKIIHAIKANALPINPALIIASYRPASNGVKCTKSLYDEKFSFNPVISNERRELRISKLNSPSESNISFMSGLKTPCGGAIAGFIETVVTYPFIRANFWRQLNGKEPMPISTKELKRSFKWITAGIGTQFIVTIPLFFMMLSGTEMINKKMEFGDSMQGRMASATIGGIMGAATNPLEVAFTTKTMLDKASGKSVQMTQAFKHIVKQDGYKFFFKGIALTASRNLTYLLGLKVFLPPVKNAVASQLPDQLGKYKDKVSIALSAPMLGFIAGFVSHPPHTIKTLQQGDLKGAKFNGTFDVISKIYRGEVYKNADGQPMKGLKPFWVGFFPSRMGRMTIGTTAVALFMESWKEFCIEDKK